MSKKRPQRTPLKKTEPSVAPRIAAGAAMLAVSVLSSLMLVLQHLVGMAIPGCGEGSPCAALSSSAWGTIPVIKLPTASFGLAYFLALLVGWIVAKGQPTAAFRWIVRAAVFFSLVLVAVIVIKQQVCWYCIAAHAGHLAFWLVMESSRTTVSANRAVTAMVSVFLLGAAALGAIEWQNASRIRRSETAQRDESIQQMIEQGQKQASQATAPSPRIPVPVPTTMLDTVAASAGTQPTSLPAPTTAPASTRGFITGRWRQGPAVAPIRIVIFSGYQCHDCRNIDMQVRTLLKMRNDVSVTPKHFPFNKDCNKHLNAVMHPNACWAARAAEAAGQLRGNAGFFQMNEWLFDRGGSFTDQELNTALAQMGYDVKQFTQVMMSPETLKPIAQDADEAVALGLYFTPMVFVNGVELRGFRVPNALIDAVEALAATNPPALGPEADRVPTAEEKAMDDWRHQRVMSVLDTASRSYPLGPADPAQIKARIVVWGDLQDPQTVALDKLVRQHLASRTDTHYFFRNFPFDQSCNSIASKTQNPLACRAARVLEAAGKIGGTEAYWKMHSWLLANAGSHRADNATAAQIASLSAAFDSALRQAAPSLGLNADQLVAAADGTAMPEVSAAVSEDINIARAVQLNNLPSLYVNNKQVQRWNIDGADLLGRILEEASQAQSASPN